jgi:hypothetical protein
MRLNEPAMHPTLIFGTGKVMGISRINELTH